MKVASLFRLGTALANLNLLVSAAAPPTLPHTAPWTAEGDLAARMVDGIGRYLDRLLAAAPTNRDRFWCGETENGPAEARRAAWLRLAETNRARLKEILGAVDERPPVTMRDTTALGAAPRPKPGFDEGKPALPYRVLPVAWSVFRGVEGEGLLLLPDGEPRADVIAVPDCDWTPEQASGLAPGVPPAQQFPRRFAEAGCRVLVPALIDRGERFAGNPGVRAVQHSQRETLWRASYELGRTPLGYETQKLLAAADWLDATRTAGPRTNTWAATLERRQNPAGRRQELGIIGYGEGGLLALYAGALDSRFLAVGVCGALGLAERLPEQPIYRSAWSMLDRFGDAELIALILPRACLAEHGQYPEVAHTDRHGGAPGRLWRPADQEFAAVPDRLAALVPGHSAELLRATPTSVCDEDLARRFYRQLVPTGDPLPALRPPPGPSPTPDLPDAAARTSRQYRQLLEDTQQLMREAEYTRREFWKRADFTSASAFTNSAAPYRAYFQREVVGRLPPASVPANPRSRFLYETNGYRGYEVQLDVYPEVFAYGLLLVPRPQTPDQRRPVVVCQHGLEGRPRDVADPTVHHEAYHQFACQLAERGFVTFAPQNPYLGGTRFRQLLRQAHPLGLTLWSFIVRQHEVIADWLAAQEFVDPGRIAFYGLSYGGKTAMRVPVLVDRYCLSICSADFNEWIWKNVSARASYSYLWTAEYDMPEWNLGNTFNYAELAWLIFPRPFMVERGHNDGVAPDEWVAYEYARVRRHYDRLRLGDRTSIEFFDGPHTSHGVGTFAFLHQHLRWP
jgi:dienelactone hydrolase